MVVPDRGASRIELAAGRTQRTRASAAGCPAGFGEGWRDAGPRSFGPEAVGGAAHGVRNQAAGSQRSDRAVAGETAGRGSDAQVRRDGLFSDRKRAGMLGVGGEKPAVPRLRDLASEIVAHGYGNGYGRTAMTCPLQSEETYLLLDYSAGRLDAARAAILAHHLETCSDCASFRKEQKTVWNALDAWEPAPVSIDFNRRLWQRIEASAIEPWYRSLAESFRFANWKPVVPLT